MVGIRFVGLGTAAGWLVGVMRISSLSAVMAGLFCVGVAGTTTLCCSAPSVGDCTVVGVTGGVSSVVVSSVRTFGVNISSNVVSCALLGLASGGGILPFSASTSSLAACTIASADVSDGIVMYLCLKYIVSEPWMPPVSGMYA